MTLAKKIFETLKVNRHVLVLNDPIFAPVHYTQHSMIQQVLYHVAPRGISLWKDTDFYFFTELLTPGIQQTDKRGFSSEFGIWEFPYVTYDELVAKARNDNGIYVSLFDPIADKTKIEQNMIAYGHDTQHYFRSHKVIIYPYERMGRDVIAGLLPIKEEMTVDECSDYFKKTLSCIGTLKELLSKNK